MAASVYIYRYTGAGPTATRIDTGGSGTARASTSDSADPGVANPIPIPSTGKNYSYWVTTGLYAATSPTSVINNIRWYTSGVSPWSGVFLQAGTASAYTEATGTLGTTGLPLNGTNYTGLSPASPTEDNAFSYTSGNPLVVSGSLSNPSTGAFGDYVVYQVAVSSAASQGVTQPLTIWWTYDEV